MTVPKVEIGFEGPARAIAFRLDDPVLGLLDTGTLGVGEALVDLTDRLVSISVRRGRTDDTEQSQAGQASVVLRNRDGLLDPLNTSSSLYPGVEPRRTMNLYADGVQVFSGFVDDIDLDYTAGGDAQVVVVASDGFSKLALAELGSVPVSAEDSGARIQSVLASDTTLWTGSTDIDAGDSTLVAGTATGNVLEYLRAVAASEAGFLFISRSGALAFRNRNNPAQNPDGLILSDAGGTACTSFTGIRRNAGSDDLYNVVTAAVGTAVVSASDTDSIDDYGIRDLDLGDVFLSSADAQSRVEFEVAKRSRALTRIASIEIDQSSTPSGCLKTLSHELGDAVTVVFSPPGVSQQTQVGVQIAVEHRWTVGSSWRTVFGLVPRDGSPFLILDDVTYGELDFGTLAF